MQNEQSLRAMLNPTFEGVGEEIDRLKRKIGKGYYLKRFRRLTGLRRRSASTAKEKYDRIAGKYQREEATLRDDTRVLAFVDDIPCFVLASALLKYHRAVLAQAVSNIAPTSLMEVGAGELNTLLPVVELLVSQPQTVIALDISAARLESGRQHDPKGLVTQYITASASEIPLPDQSVDVIMTSHCLEQSPELVGPALKEFARVAKRRIVLAEPAYELAHALQRKRIRRIGYARGIAKTAKQLGLSVVSHELIPVRTFHNGSALTVIDV